MTWRLFMTICLIASGFAAGCAHRAQAPAANDEQGFAPIFNGHDLSGWVYGQTPEGKSRQTGNGYQVRPEDHVLFCTATDGGVLFTEKEYSDFVMRYDFTLG